MYDLRHSTGASLARVTLVDVFKAPEKDSAAPGCLPAGGYLQVVLDFSSSVGQAIHCCHVSLTLEVIECPNAALMSQRRRARSGNEGGGTHVGEAGVGRGELWRAWGAGRARCRQ